MIEETKMKEKKNEIVITAENEKVALTGHILQALFRLDGETQSDDGMNYKPLYFGLYNGISEIINNAFSYEQVIESLKHLQCKAEDFYIQSA
jgi:hypothetical protein